ncbi:MAG: S8 family peptidase [Candidatus Peribacteraceae bacterium]|nr:S8 family peptidase [Candidatus Peribacteraceae bacterium]MDD5741968.1 S8 family peptidase [Candidatus Peribacteraceae bacterium]
MKTRTPLFFSVFLCCAIALHGAVMLPAARAAQTPRPAGIVNGKTEGERRRQKDSRVRTCNETGLCAANEERLLLGSKSPKEVFSALLKGCHAQRWLNNDVVLKCPKDVSIPGATTERVFSTQDYFSADQITALAVQQQNIKGSGVRVAVLDTGIDPTHPEIAARIVEQASFVTGATPLDGHGHGTHVAGIVAGAGSAIHQDDNGANRILGTAPQADLLIGKVCNDEGWCAEGDILAGIEWAVGKNAKVINLSLGGGAFMSACDGDPMAAKANWAANQGTLVVAAAGNGADTTPGVSTPGCASKAVAVGALDRSNTRVSWSGNGPALDVMAPGLGILSSLPCAVAGTCPEAGYGWWSGTSMASPHVAGIAALVRGVNPSLTADETRTVLTQSAYDLGAAGLDDSYGFGRVDALSAVARAKDFDSDGSPIPADCNDRDASVSPLKSEVCGNGVDDDCDAAVDEGCAVPSPAPSSSSFSSSVPSASSVSSVSSASSRFSSSHSSSSFASSSRFSSAFSSSSSQQEDENDHEDNDGGQYSSGSRQEREREREREQEGSSRSSQQDGNDHRACPWWNRWIPWSTDCRPQELPNPPNRPIEMPPGQDREKSSSGQERDTGNRDR